MRRLILLGWMVGQGACVEPAVKEPTDLDGDGFEAPEDCDDTSAGISPDADERCNGLDDDCDAEVDEIGAEDGSLGFLDGDGDGYGGEAVVSCGGAGVSIYPGDCDDQDPDVSPAAEERCDGLDDDCDGLTDEVGAVDGTEWPLDQDRDGYGHPIRTGLGCGPGDGLAASADDCDDADPTRNPGVGEICTNDQDDDCDGVVDERDDTDPPTWYADGDDDGYGDGTQTLGQCDPPVGYTSNDADCDDSDASVHPGAPDPTDEQDNDCDGEIDELGDTDGEGELTWALGAGRTACKLYWDAEWDEVYPPTRGLYMWNTEQVLDDDQSRNETRCDGSEPADTFRWTVAWVEDGADQGARDVWVLYEGSTMWRPAFDGELAGQALTFSVERETGDQDQTATFSAEISFPGL